MNRTALNTLLVKLGVDEETANRLNGDRAQLARARKAD